MSFRRHDTCHFSIQDIALEGLPPRILAASGKQRWFLRGLVVFDEFGHHYRAFAMQLRERVNAGNHQYREEVIEALELAPSAFVGLMNGKAFGKRVVKLTV